jgi:hypothetical protein
MNYTNGIPDSPPLSDSDDHGDSLVIYPHLRDLECKIASRIVAWVNAHPEMPYYRDYILMLTPDALTSEFMERLAFGLYRHTDAPTWLSWHDAPGSASRVWLAGILRASTLLNSPA